MNGEVMSVLCAHVGTHHMCARMCWRGWGKGKPGMVHALFSFSLTCILSVFLILPFCFLQTSNAGNYRWNLPLRSGEKKINFPTV